MSLASPKLRSNDLWAAEEEEEKKQAPNHQLKLELVQQTNLNADCWISVSARGERPVGSRVSAVVIMR